MDFSFEWDGEEGRLIFEWDGEKARINFKGHHVAFREAATVFGDPLALTSDDPLHSNDEERSTIIGQSERGRLLRVSFTERGDSIRIISAREAEPSERRAYESGT
jgi:uncharacterized DUF497 family protein